MPIELDHLFVCVSQGAPEAESLVDFGLCEGSRNQHPGQGTANRRFPLRNAMIEMVWVSDAAEAQSEGTRRTRLWERWTERDRGGCPFGICVRPAEGAPDEIPFPAWNYQPSYLAAPLAMHIGEAELDEPMWVYLGFMQRSNREKHFLANRKGIRDITGLVLTTPRPPRSATAQAVIDSGVIASRSGDAYMLDVEFDGGRARQVRDFRPHLPLAFHY